MGLKIVAGIVAVVLMLAYLGPIVLKLQEFALTLVILSGIVLMLIDLWQSMQSKSD